MISVSNRICELLYKAHSNNRDPKSVYLGEQEWEHVRAEFQCQGDSTIYKNEVLGLQVYLVKQTNHLVVV